MAAALITQIQAFMDLIQMLVRPLFFVPAAQSTARSPLYPGS